jgi:diacylglycerol kinase (ATP)
MTWPVSLPGRGSAWPPGVTPVGARPTRAALVINRQARKGGGGPWESTVMKTLARRFATTALYPRSATEMVSTVRTQLARLDTLVIVAGGDGSFNAALAATLALPAGCAGPLAILPLGTANDLARALALPLDPIAAARRLLDAQPRRWDCLAVNRHPFVTVGGFGTAADVAAGVARLRARTGFGAAAVRLLGSRIYHLAAAEIIAAAPFAPATVAIDLVPPGAGSRVQRQARTPAVLIANQGTLAGLLRVSPASRPDDGVFEICVFRATTRTGLLSTLVRLLTGAPTPDIDVWPATAARITLDRRLPFFGDGELLDDADQFDISVAPGAFSLFA